MPIYHTTLLNKLDQYFIGVTNYLKAEIIKIILNIVTIII